MNRRPCCPEVILALVAVALILPIAVTVILGLAALLAAMRDAAGGLVLRYVALGLGVVWAVDLVCLVLTLGFNSLSEPLDEGELEIGEETGWKAHPTTGQEEPER
jgi:hypothetical protein